MENALRAWLSELTAAEKVQLAAAAGLSMNHLYLLAGHRPVSTVMAARLERASLTLSRVRDGILPVLSRCEINSTCSRCPHRPGGER